MQRIDKIPYPWQSAPDPPFWPYYSQEKFTFSNNMLYGLVPFWICFSAFLLCIFFISVLPFCISLYYSLILLNSYPFKLYLSSSSSMKPFRLFQWPEKASDLVPDAPHLWHSWSCIILSLWVWAGSGDLVLTFFEKDQKRLKQKFIEIKIILLRLLTLG